MPKWSLPDLLTGLHQKLQSELSQARELIQHAGSKGDASESVWLHLFQTYLPKRYQVTHGFVVDSHNQFSDQMDVIIYDRQYTPFIFQFVNIKIIPAEAVYAVFEAKQTCHVHNLQYAQDKVASVRKLHRTSLPIPHAGGKYDPKPSHPILGGLLCLTSDWKHPMGQELQRALAKGNDDNRLDLGCIAEQGFFAFDKKTKRHHCQHSSKAATVFLLELMATLQEYGTVPMIDPRAYAQWLQD